MATDTSAISPASRSERPIERLRFDAGSLSLNLAATVGRRRTDDPVERLWDAARLERWLDRVGLRSSEHGWAVTEDQLGPIRELREAIYRVTLAAIEGGASPRSGDLALINSHASGPLCPPRLAWRNSATGGSRPERVTDVQPDLAAALAAIATDAIDTITGDHRLRACEGDVCGMLFLDTSQGARRRWCSMTRCGNRAKVARHRHRAPTKSE